MSVSPACRAANRSRATSSRVTTGSGSSPYRSRELVAHRGHVVLGVDRGDRGVGREPQPLARHVVVRDVRVDRQLDPDLGPLGRRVVLQLAHRLADHPHVEVEPDPGDVPGLLAAEQVPGAADLQVLQRDVHAGADLGVLRHRGQPLVRGLGQRLLRRVEEVRVRPLPAAADPAAQLVQLRQPGGVGPVHDQRVRVRDVEPGLDDRRRHQHVEVPVPEVRP